MIAWAGEPSLDDLLDEATRTLEQVTDASVYERAVHYLYLSETRSSYGIEKETPSGNKGERFVQLLARAGEEEHISEDWLVDLQNAIVKDAYAQEASYRIKQNWLEDGTRRITFFPPPPEDLPLAMQGWEAFINGARRLRGGAIVPVSAVVLRGTDEYLDVLNRFSRPTTRLWTYSRGEEAPHVTESPCGRPYRFFDATPARHARRGRSNVSSIQSPADDQKKASLI